MRIHGLDLSLNSAGLCTVDIDNVSLETQAITVGNDLGKPYSERYDAVLKAIIAEVDPEDVVFIEDYAYGSKSALTLLAELGGIVRYVLWKKTGLWPFPVGVESVKKFATGKGGGKKEDIKLGVYKKWKLEFPTNDEVDAFVLAEIGLVLLGADPFPMRSGDNWHGYEFTVAEALKKGGLKNRNDELQALAEKMA